jgi:hypothetical protein
MTQRLEWTRSEGRSWWWLKEATTLFADTNYYDVIQQHDDTLFYIRTGIAAHPEEKVVAGPFSTCEEAQAIAEMMHKMEVWR